MIWGAHGAQHPSDGSIRQHRVSENDMCVICIYAGQMMYDPASGWRPQQDSNLRSRLRRAMAGITMASQETHRRQSRGRAQDAAPS